MSGIVAGEFAPYHLHEDGKRTATAKERVVMDLLSGHGTASRADRASRNADPCGPVAFTAFNYIVGVGIFSLPGLVAGVLGPAAIAAYLVCAVLIGQVGLCFAEAAGRVAGNSGLCVYAGAAFRPVIGGVAGALLPRYAGERVACAGAGRGGRRAVVGDLRHAGADQRRGVRATAPGSPSRWACSSCCRWSRSSCSASP